jgi:hypothetical protein
MPIELSPEQRFMDLSSELTGFTHFTLYGTGYAKKYFETAENIVGTDLMSELLQAFHAVIAQAGKDAVRKDSLLRAHILSHEKLGPIARNIIKMWYVAIWFELPRAWHDQFGPLANDDTFVVSTYAYPEGLLAPAVGAHPQAAKAPGYGTWADPPQILKL